LCVKCSDGAFLRQPSPVCSCLGGSLGRGAFKVDQEKRKPWYNQPRDRENGKDRGASVKGWPKEQWTYDRVLLEWREAVKKVVILLADKGFRSKDGSTWWEPSGKKAVQFSVVKKREDTSNLSMRTKVRNFSTIDHAGGTLTLGVTQQKGVKKKYNQNARVELSLRPGEEQRGEGTE